MLRFLLAVRICATILEGSFPKYFHDWCLMMTKDKINLTSYPAFKRKENRRNTATKPYILRCLFYLFCARMEKDISELCSLSLTVHEPHTFRSVIYYSIDSAVNVFS